MKFYYVYILKCNDDSLYVGVTSDIDRRLTEHNAGKYPEAYTHNRRPVSLVFCQEFTDPNQAIEFRAWAEEAAVSRIYGGIHWRFDAEAGLNEGRKVAEYTVNKAKLDGSN